MGQNSTEVAYGFGQLGSAYTDLAKPIIPPQGMVIIAIQFLGDNIPTVLTAEKLDGRGPGFNSISNATGVVMAGSEFLNFNGLTRSTCTGAQTTVHTTNDTLTISATNSEIQEGQYVLLVNTSDTEAAGLTVDADTPAPIYEGPNKRGLYVTKVNGVNITLSEALATNAPSSQDLIFLGPEQGAGGITSGGQLYPKGVVIYGRWSEFQGGASGAAGIGGVICYFGK